MEEGALQLPPPAPAPSHVASFHSSQEAQADFRLLVVGGDEQDHSSLHGILRQDCQLHQVAGRRDALTFVRQFHPRVVVCDQNLADGDWRELLKDLQGEPQMPPLIVSSRLADDRLFAEVLNLGGYDLLTKPYAPTEVSRVVKMAAHRGSKSGGC